MNTYYFPIQSMSLAHYFGAAIIKPAKYFANKPHDIQDEYKDFLLVTTKKGTTETDCCLEIVLTNDEIKDLIDVKGGWFLFDVNPLPITRIRKIYFSDIEKRDTTIRNIRMSTAYVPEGLIGLCEFANNPTSVIRVPSDCNAVLQNKDNIVRFDRILGALALLKIVGEPYMNYSSNYIATLSFFNSLIEEQVNKVPNLLVKKNYQGLFDNSKGFERITPYLESQIDEQTLDKIAEENKQEIKKDKITRIIDVDSLTDTWTYTIAILNTYGVGEESRRKRVDGLIQSHFSGLKQGKAEGVALCFGYNRGYSAFTKDYGTDQKVPYKYKMESQLDYYTIESIYQYVFNGVISRDFPYLDEWCPKNQIEKPQRKTDYIILDEVIIGKKAARVFSEEWRKEIFPKFSKEFSALATPIFQFFQEICEEMETDLDDELMDIKSDYEERLKEKNKQIADLTYKLDEMIKGLAVPNNKQGGNVPDKVAPLIMKGGTDLNKLKVPELRELAKSRGINVPSKAKKSEILKLLSAQRIASSDMFTPSE